MKKNGLKNRGQYSKPPQISFNMGLCYGGAAAIVLNVVCPPFILVIEIESLCQPSRVYLGSIGTRQAFFSRLTFVCQLVCLSNVPNLAR